MILSEQGFPEEVAGHDGGQTFLSGLEDVDFGRFLSGRQELLLRQIGLDSDEAERLAVDNLGPVGSKVPKVRAAPTYLFEYFAAHYSPDSALRRWTSFLCWADMGYLRSSLRCGRSVRRLMLSIAA